MHRAAAGRVVRHRHQQVCSPRPCPGHPGRCRPRAPCPLHHPPHPPQPRRQRHPGCCPPRRPNRTRPGWSDREHQLALGLLGAGDLQHGSQVGVGHGHQVSQVPAEDERALHALLCLLGVWGQGHRQGGGEQGAKWSGGCGAGDGACRGWEYCLWLCAMQGGCSTAHHGTQGAVSLPQG
jgi:hypothetical protein